MHLDSVVTALDLLSTFAFAIVGARIAASRHMDYGGITLIAATASLSGGTLRNVFIGAQPPWLQHPWLFASVLLAVLLTIFSKDSGPVGRFILSLDTLGLAVATVSSANYTISMNANFLGAVILGLIGAVTGGLLRDVFCQVEPVLLHRETIGTSCFAGALTYVSLYHLNTPTIVSVLVGGTVVVLVRELSIKFNLNLPRLK